MVWSTKSKMSVQRQTYSQKLPEGDGIRQLPSLRLYISSSSMAASVVAAANDVVSSAGARQNLVAHSSPFQLSSRPCASKRMHQSSASVLASGFRRSLTCTGHWERRMEVQAHCRWKSSSLNPPSS